MEEWTSFCSWDSCLLLIACVPALKLSRRLGDVPMALLGDDGKSEKTYLLRKIIKNMDNNLGFKMTVSAIWCMTWKAFIKMKLLEKNSFILYHNYHIDIHIYIYIYIYIYLCKLLYVFFFEADFSSHWPHVQDDWVNPGGCFRNWKGWDIYGVNLITHRINAAMHDRFSSIYQKHQVTVDKYTIHGSYGKVIFGL